MKPIHFDRGLERKNMKNSSLKFASKSKLVLYTLLSIVSALGNVVIAYVTKIMLNAAQYRHGNINDLIMIALSGVAAILIIMFSNFGYRYLKTAIVKEINIGLKEKTMTYLVKQQSESQKEGLSLMTNDLKQIETFKVLNELAIISEIVAFIISIVVGVINSWILTLVFMLTTLIPGVVQRLFTKPIQAKSEIWEKTNANYTQKVSDGLNGAPTASLYDVQVPVIERVVLAAKRMEQALKQLNYTQAVAGEIIMATADIFSFILPFLIGAILMFQGKIGAGTLVMIVQLSNEFINPIVSIFQQLNEIKSTKPMWDKVQAAIDFQGDAPKNNNSFTGLELKNISYKQKGKAIISNLDFQLKPNEKILLMAPSGWGKTTLLNLILGKNKATAGEILINHQNTSGPDHSLFSYVNQKPFIFDDSLRFNILLGRSFDPTRLDQVIKTAGLSELIQEKGWDYQVGEKGGKLSGGQIQRIEIARALLADRPVLLADEATSALDSKLSFKIHQAILQNPKLAVIEVAHKISDKEKAMFDRIVKLG